MTYRLGGGCSILLSYEGGGLRRVFFVGTCLEHGSRVSNESAHQHSNKRTADQRDSHADAREQLSRTVLNWLDAPEDRSAVHTMVMHFP